MAKSDSLIFGQWLIRSVVGYLEIISTVEIINVMHTKRTIPIFYRHAKYSK